MSEKVSAGWLTNYDGNKFAPKTIMNELYTPTGLLMCANLDANNNLGSANQPIYIDNGQFKVCAEGDLRVEFDSGILATRTYSYAGNKSKFYIVTINLLELTPTFYTIVIDCSVLAADSYYNFMGWDSGDDKCSIKLALDSNKYPTFTFASGQSSNNFYNIRGYY